MLTLTDVAIEKVKELSAAEPSAQGKALRVLVEPGHGCSAYQYGFTFDDKKDGDTELTMGDLKVLVDPQSAPLLSGCVIDFKDDFSGAGFAISNPNAKKSCGCGKSFDA
jgi:iron-sulfur cluster assembly accessory protein